MNLPQRIVVIVGALAVALNTLFAPWVFVFEPPAGAGFTHSERFAGYHLITNASEPQDATALSQIFHCPSGLMLRYVSMRIDTRRLFAQLAGLLCVIALGFFAVKGRREPVMRYGDLSPN